MGNTLDLLLKTISQHTYQPESDSIALLLHEIQDIEQHWHSIYNDAYTMINHLRTHGLGMSIEPFLQEYNLSSEEGVAIMCLAEALLRIPDDRTADRLINATFSDKDWEKHIGKSESLMVNASSWGLLLTGKTLKLTKSSFNVENLISSIVKKSSNYTIRETLKKAMQIIATQFVMGENTQAALKKAKRFEQKGYRFSYDMLGEGARTQQQADHYFASYLNTIRAMGNHNHTSLYDAPGISIKLSAIHPRVEWSQKERLISELIPKLKQLTQEAKQQQITLSIDAEEAARLDISCELFKELFLSPEFNDFEGIGFVLQAYQKRAWYVIDFLAELSKKTHKKMPIRLVKGAYWDTEIKHAQMHGVKNYPVYTYKAHSDVSYLACAKKILAHAECFYPQFATHNILTIYAIKHMAQNIPYEFQRLYGMGEKIYDTILKEVPCRIYAPIGEHKDLLAYLIRRLLENGANSSFINTMMNKNIPIETILTSPLEAARKQQQHNSPVIPLPKNIYKPSRMNSKGYDTGIRHHVTYLEKQLAKHKQNSFSTPKEPSKKAIATLCNQTHEAFNTWQHVPAITRAAYLKKTAKLLEKHYIQAMSLCIQEAGKTIPDAIAEVREAIDFCHYYAQQCKKHFAKPTQLISPTGEENTLTLHGRGTFICISPWNFPLAIFLGQVTAALAAGNCVIAKPAEQTPAIATFAVDLLHQAGFPKDVIQLVPGDGAIVGKQLLTHPATAGVCFTGSTETARIINQTLAQRDGPIIPLIAETGGLNCMIVDNSALIEQVTDDIITSAFGSAGQRCSALRCAFIPEAIADTLIQSLTGALAELRIDNPELLATDIGPVIDKEAHNNLQKHIKHMKKVGTLIATHKPQMRSYNNKPFIAPHIFEISSLNQLHKESFGPILHIIRYKPGEVASIIESINQSGYGLTCGVHSRIHTFYHQTANRIHAGNKYINRDMIGAVVGVQPFGGENMSGTGPKAGGPHYVLRFATERVTTINTAAIGGNIQLLVQ